MKQMQLTVAGNLTADPDRHYGHRSGQPFTTFRLAHNRENFDREAGRWAQTGTDYLKVVAFGALGLNIQECLKKGDPVVVQGRLSLKEWEQGEKSGTDAEIRADVVGWDFNFGQGTFRKVRRPTVSGVDPTDDPSVRTVMREMGAEPQEPPEEDYGVVEQDFDETGSAQTSGAEAGDVADPGPEEYAEPTAS